MCNASVVRSDPNNMNCVLAVVAADALSSDKKQSDERAKALLEAAGVDIRARKKKNQGDAL